MRTSFNAEKLAWGLDIGFQVLRSPVWCQCLKTLRGASAAVLVMLGRELWPDCELQWYFANPYVSLQSSFSFERQLPKSKCIAICAKIPSLSPSFVFSFPPHSPFFFFFKDMFLLCSPKWPETYYLAPTTYELMTILLLCPFKCWDYRCETLQSFLINWLYSGGSSLFISL